MASARLRKPDKAFEGKNGFREAGDLPVDQANPDDVTLRNVRLAHYVLANRGFHLPSPDALRKLGEAKSAPVETVESVTSKIKALKKQHVKDLSALFKFQLAEYHQELVDHRICHDDSAYMDIDEAYPDQVEFKKALEDLDARIPKMDRLKRDMDDAVSTFRYIYIKNLLQLTSRRNVLKSQEKAAQQKRNAWFPQTISQYEQITERDVQLRVARFLTSSTVEQEKMRDEFGWPYRAVQPLLVIYKSNPSFKNDVNNALSGLIVSDPRRRASRSLMLEVPEDAPVFKKFSPVS